MMKMIEVLGLPPQHLLTDAPKVSKYFDRRADGVFVLKQPECRQVTGSVCLFVHGCQPSHCVCIGEYDGVQCVLMACLY